MLHAHLTLGIQAALPQGILDDLLQAGLGALIRERRFCAAELYVAEVDQVAEVGAVFLGGGVEEGLLLGDFAGALAFDVERRVEAGGVRFGGVAEVAV